MPISRDELASLVPLTALSVIKWFRDRYLYNRTRGAWWTASRVQAQVLVLLYPVWIFLTWTTGLQYRRGIAFALVSTTGSQVVEHLTSIALLNDSFLQTRQQVVSSAFGLIIAYTWTIYNQMAFSVGDEKGDVETNHSECHCDARQ
jgi:hypothetical protein